MLVPHGDSDNDSDGNDSESLPLIINITVVIDPNNVHKAMQASEVLTRTCVGLALDGIAVDINIFQPVELEYVTPTDDPS